MALKFDKNLVLNRFHLVNPWWETGRLDTYNQSFRRREYFKLLFPLVKQSKPKRALILMGPRRVGKTVLLHQSIQELIDQGTDPKNICYLQIDAPILSGLHLEELVNLYLAVFKKSKEDKLYIIFDEIQYLKDWEVHLKSLVDVYHNFKFIVSGSAAAALKLKSRESGAGRFTEFVLPPLSFYEYLLLTDSDYLIRNEVVDSAEFMIVSVSSYESINIDLLNEKFIDYINYGGYPELSLSEEARKDPRRYVREDILDKVLMRDLPSLYGIRDIQELYSLFSYLAYHTGSELSLDELSKNSGVAKNTIKKYIEYLEAAFLIKTIQRVDYNGARFKRKTFFKVYLTNCSLRSALFAPLKTSDGEIGSLVETAIFSQWQPDRFRQLYYARWKTGEIDIVGLDSHSRPEWAKEIKWSNGYVDKPGDLRSAVNFCVKNKLKRLGVTTIDKTAKRNLDGMDIYFQPAALYAYTVGKNIFAENVMLQRMRDARG